MEAVKTIIITGGGGHLGRCVARWWAKPHAHLMLIDRDAGRLDKTRVDLATSGAETIILAMDATMPDDLQMARPRFPGRYGARRPRSSWRTGSPAKVSAANHRDWANWITTVGTKSSTPTSHRSCSRLMPSCPT